MNTVSHLIINIKTVVFTKIKIRFEFNLNLNSYLHFELIFAIKYKMRIYIEI